ncbi:MAG: DUF4097 family beta strand repeat protein [Pseudobacteriovorax sp.]|nr:DUF4097 family beta strand repeat protein [Pseudobacteriovorax sp.]
MLKLLMSFVLITFAADNALSKDIERTFKVSVNPVIDFETNAGPIFIEGSDRKDVKLTVSGWGVSDDNVTLESSTKGKELIIRARIKGGNGNVRYQLEVPKISGVKIRTAGGSLHIENIRGNVAGETRGGSIHMEKISGRAVVKSRGGSLHLEDVSGDIDVETNGGSIHAERSEGKLKFTTNGGSMNLEKVAGELKAETGGGSMNVSMDQPIKKGIRLRTGGGNIVLQLPSSADVSLDASTGFGKVLLFDRDKKLLKSVDRRLSYKLKNGKVPVDISTGAGSIEIFSR